MTLEDAIKSGKNFEEVTWVFNESGTRYHGLIAEPGDLVKSILHTRKRESPTSTVTIEPITLDTLLRINNMADPRESTEYKNGLGNQYRIDSASNLLAASVSELSGCSSDAVHVIELALEEALASATIDQVKAVYDAVNAAFMEGE